MFEINMPQEPFKSSPALRSQPEALRAALAYIKRGWPVLPLHNPNGAGTCSCGRPDCSSPAKHPRMRNGLKDATKDPATAAGLWKRWPQANIGIVCGISSGLVVLDVDGQEGELSLDELQTELGPLPESVEALTARGRHIYFKHPGGGIIRPSASLLAPGLDVRGDGSYVVGPPSVHVSGHQYTWELSSHPRDTELAGLPAAWIERLRQQDRRSKELPGRKGKNQGSPDRADADVPIPQGQRNAVLTSKAGIMRRAGFSEQAILEALLALNVERCHPPLTDREVGEISRSVARYKPAADRAVMASGFMAGDIKNAQRLRLELDGNMLYAPERKCWLGWDGKVWKWDIGESAIYSFSKKVIDQIAKDATASGNRDEQEALFGEAMRLSSLNKQKSMIEQCSKEKDLQIFASELDKDPFLFCCENGIIDLKNGQLRAHRRGDHITKMSPVTFDPDAKSKVFDEFLERVQPDPDVRGFLQRWFGYSLTGSVAEEKLVFVIGPPAGGKTTLVEAIRSVLGPYAVTLSFDTLLKRKYARSGDARPDIAKLVGVRFASAVEAAGDSAFDEELINQICGGDTVSTRHLYGEEFDFKPVVKITLAANNVPAVSGRAGAIWRRLRLIPFPVSIPPEERDPALKTRLQSTERAAILRWAVEGCLLWQKEGLGDPEAVRLLTEQEQDSSDPLQFFLDDVCIMRPGASVKNPELWRAYLGWTKENRIRPLGRKTFTKLLEDRPGIDSYRSDGRVWTGIGLLVELPAGDGWTNDTAAQW